jgi:hypothetical protein
MGTAAVEENRRHRANTCHDSRHTVRESSPAHGNTVCTSLSLWHRRDSVHKTETGKMNLVRCLDALCLTEETRCRTNLAAGTQHAVSEESASKIKLRTR